MKLRVLVSSQGQIKELDLEASEVIVIGRSPQPAAPTGGPAADVSNLRIASRSGVAHLNLPDADASRRHAAFYLDRTGKMRVKDLGSLNGTVVAGQKIRDVEVKVGSRVEIGSAEIVLLGFSVYPPPLPSRR